MIKRLLLQAAASLAKEEGRKKAAAAARSLAEKAAPRVTRFAAKRGWADKEKSLDEILAELDAMRKSGKLAPDQWRALRDELTERWKNRRTS